MTLSGLQFEVVLFTLSGLKVKEGGFIINLLMFVSDLLDVIDYKLYLNQGKTRLPNCPLF